MVFAIVFALGLTAVVWVGMGLLGAGGLALAMTLAIAGVYLLGVRELYRFRLATASLAAALGRIPQPVVHVGGWIDSLPKSLQHTVRLRIEGERIALPGPALTPYLVGLLVMLGMLGTFLGMVVTFKGAVFALEGSTDMQAIKAALAAPIKGLGLSFGTSVAGVAASAALGLLSAICRRERALTGRQLDDCIGTVLRPFSLAHQREESLKALQAQAGAWPQIVNSLDALILRFEHRQQQVNALLAGQQEAFHQQVRVAYTDLSQAVGRSLHTSLVASAEVASQTIQPLVARAMAELAEESRRAQGHLDALAQTQLAVLSDRFGALLTAVQQTLDKTVSDIASDSHEQSRRMLDSLAALRGQSEALVSSCAAQDKLALEERAGLLARVQALADTATEASGKQQAATESLLAATAQVLESAGNHFSHTLDAHAGRADSLAAHIGASAIELSCLGEAFQHGVQNFSLSNDKLIASLQRVEERMGQSMTRSDEQLAYYVAQAREVIDLSLTSQQGLVEAMQRLQGNHRTDLVEAAA